MVVPLSNPKKDDPMVSPLKKFVIIMLLFPVLILSGSYGADANESESIIEFDFEENDGSFTHGGRNDSWEWGEPGPGNGSNPGPVSSGEGNGCFGSPLNGTYEEGTESYLGIPTISLETYQYAIMEFMLWYDLDLKEDEMNDSGEGPANDYLLIEIKDRDGEWNIVGNYSGDSGGEWLTESVDLSAFDIVTLDIRFVLKDVVDGRVDNGVFIDMVKVMGVPRPREDISLYGPPSMAKTVPTFTATLIHFTIMNEGTVIPPDTFVDITINGPSGWNGFYHKVDIDPERMSKRSISWTPTVEGIYTVHVNLTVDGTIEEDYRSVVEVHDPIFYDDLSLGWDLWDSSTIEGDNDWYLVGSESDHESSSSGGMLRFGDDLGFSGEAYAYVETPEFDLTGLDEADLFIFQSYGFMGELGSCGGVVQAYNADGQWVTLSPYLPHTRQLYAGVSGPLGGEQAFQGDREWYQIGFDLDDIVGTTTVIRFSVSSGSAGEGRGWMIDDILVTGQGVDPYDTQPPEPIQGIEVDIISDGEVEVTWDASFASDIDHYNVYLGNGNPVIGSANLVDEIDADRETLVTFSDLDGSREHWVAITGVDWNGNEDTSISPKFFFPMISETNEPPVARARVVGSSTLRVGEEFIFNASSSFDPEGGRVEFRWTMPDGKNEEGEQVRWRPKVSGNGLIVRLIVTDGQGLSGYQNITVDVEEDGLTDLQSEDLSSFLICMAPIVIALITAVIIVAWIRSSRQKRIKRNLLMSGIEPETNTTIVKAEVIESPEKRSRRPSKQVLDLEPVIVTKSRQKPIVPRRAPPPPPPSSPVKSEPLKDLKMHEKSQSQSKDNKGKKVTALVECPFCNSSFRTSISQAELSSGEGFEIHCPHCGRSGTID